MGRLGGCGIAARLAKGEAAQAQQQGAEGDQEAKDEQEGQWEEGPGAIRAEVGA